jgi:pimeloyl-ACP methyl ester carboxylesterase
LIAHDWGGAVAWFFAIRRLRPLEHLVILNMPHPAVFDHCLRSSWRQLLRSWYIAFFQVPVVPEFLLGLDRARAIELIFRATDPARFDDDVVKVYRDQAAQPGALTAMLNWYRAASRGLRAQLDLGVPVIEVPTLMLWGEADVALRKETTYGTEKYVNNLRLNYLPGVSHWTQQDAPERVNELLVEFLR